MSRSRGIWEVAAASALTQKKTLAARNPTSESIRSGPYQCMCRVCECIGLGNPHDRQMPVNVPRYEIELEQLNFPLVIETCCGAVQWRLSNAEEPGKRGM